MVLFFLLCKLLYSFFYLIEMWTAKNQIMSLNIPYLVLYCNGFILSWCTIFICCMMVTRIVWVFSLPCTRGVQASDCSHTRGWVKHLYPVILFDVPQKPYLNDQPPNVIFILPKIDISTEIAEYPHSAVSPQHGFILACNGRGFLSPGLLPPRIKETGLSYGGVLLLPMTSENHIPFLQPEIYHYMPLELKGIFPRRG
jgi:hypothetical protein